MEPLIGGAIAACSAGAALAVTAGVREAALRRLVLDYPNARSAHHVPTPRLGGIGIMLPFLVGSTAWVAIEGHGAWRSTLMVLCCTAAISALGAADDMRSLPARWRFALQALAATAVVLWRGSAVAEAMAPFDSFLPAAGLMAASILWIVWATNLYNFMDGIDGLAGGQAVWASAGLAVAALWTGDLVVAWMLVFLGASSAGFLRHNLPRASIFMGDAGSTAIGFFLASVPFASTAGPLPVLAVVLALSLFVLDATTTLLRRLVQRERWYAAHRTHLYQRPLARGVSHARITYSAYAGMAVLAGMAALYPRVGPRGRGLMFGAALLIFVGYWLVVRGLERRADASRVEVARRPDGGPVS